MTTAVVSPHDPSDSDPPPYSDVIASTPPPVIASTSSSVIATPSCQLPRLSFRIHHHMIPSNYQLLSYSVPVHRVITDENMSPVFTTVRLIPALLRQAEQLSYDLRFDPTQFDTFLIDLANAKVGEGIHLIPEGESRVSLSYPDLAHQLKQLQAGQTYSVNVVFQGILSSKFNDCLYDAKVNSFADQVDFTMKQFREISPDSKRPGTDDGDESISSAPLRDQHEDVLCSLELSNVNEAMSTDNLADSSEVPSQPVLEVTQDILSDASNVPIQASSTSAPIQDGVSQVLFRSTKSETNYESSRLHDTGLSSSQSVPEGNTQGLRSRRMEQTSVPLIIPGEGSNTHFDDSELSSTRTASEDSGQNSQRFKSVRKSDLSHLQTCETRKRQSDLHLSSAQESLENKSDHSLSYDSVRSQVSVRTNRVKNTHDPYQPLRNDRPRQRSNQSSNRHSGFTPQVAQRFSQVKVNPERRPRSRSSFSPSVSPIQEEPRDSLPFQCKMPAQYSTPNIPSSRYHMDRSADDYKHHVPTARLNPDARNPRQGSYDRDDFSSDHSSHSSGYFRDHTSDPGHDSYGNRDDFGQPPSGSQVDTRNTQRDRLNGTHWTHFTTDPFRGELHVDRHSGMMKPWMAYRPDYGYILNYPLRMKLDFLDKSTFLATFAVCFDMKNLRDFQRGFPSISKHATRFKFMDFHNRLVTYCSGWKIYVPPLHTLRADQPMGLWFDELPEHTKNISILNISSVLAHMLRSKYSGLLDSPQMASIVHQSTNGYDALLQLATIAGHPSLSVFPKTPQEPLQGSDCSLSSYLHNWNYYLQIRLLDGTILSDRYFIQQVVNGMHHSVKPSMGVWLEQSMAPFQIGQPLPTSYAPSKLLAKLTQRATHIQKPRLITDVPRDFASSSAQIHEVRTELCAELEEFEPMIAALQQDKRACYVCGASDHLMQGCPKLKALVARGFTLQRNPQAHKKLSVQDVRQIQSDEQDNDLSSTASTAVIQNIGEDEDSITSEKSDF